MTNNFPIEQKDQHEHPKFSYNDYIATGGEMVTNDTSSDSSAEVAIEMSRSIHDMRRAFHKTVRKLRNSHADVEPRASFEYSPPISLRFTKRRAMG